MSCEEERRGEGFSAMTRQGRDAASRYHAKMVFTFTIIVI
jgi:hypothetical protein